MQEPEEGRCAPHSPVLAFTHHALRFSPLSHSPGHMTGYQDYPWVSQGKEPNHRGQEFPLLCLHGSGRS